MKKSSILCLGLCATLMITGCKSKESAYRKAYDKAKAAEAYKRVTAMLDKLAGKNIISKNKAANLKSKLAHHINKLEA